MRTKEEMARAMNSEDIQVRQDGIEKEREKLKEEWQMLEHIKRERRGEEKP